MFGAFEGCFASSMIPSLDNNRHLEFETWGRYLLSHYLTRRRAHDASITQYVDPHEAGF